MIRAILFCVSILVLFTTAVPARETGQIAKDRQLLRSASSPAGSTKENCETRIRKLDASEAEGVERLAEKNEVIDVCASQYKRDKTIGRLVNECSKYEEQPIVKQQSVAECQLAAFNYANALRTLKAEYGK